MFPPPITIESTHLTLIVEYIPWTKITVKRGEIASIYMYIFSIPLDDPVEGK